MNSLLTPGLINLISRIETCWKRICKLNWMNFSWIKLTIPNILLDLTKWKNRNLSETFSCGLRISLSSRKWRRNKLRFKSLKRKRWKRKSQRLKSQRLKNLMWTRLRVKSQNSSNQRSKNQKLKKLKPQFKNLSHRSQCKNQIKSQKPKNHQKSLFKLKNQPNLRPKWNKMTPW